MIDPIVFKNKLTIISNHFDRKLQPEVITVWLKYLNNELTTQEFEEASDQILISSRFFPTAQDFVEKVKGAKEARAAQEWQQILTAAARNDQEAIVYLSNRAKVALRVIGGLNEVGYADDNKRGRLEKNFTTVYCQYADKDANTLPPAQPKPKQKEQPTEFEVVPIPPDLKARMDALAQKRGISRKR